mgnify:CR=1 FL=1
MINGVNLNPNILPSAQSKPQARASEPSFVGNHEMSPEVSSAYRAYGQAMVNKPYEQLSLNDCILQLQRQGKVEGKDYEFENCSGGSVAIYLLNKDGQETKRMLYHDGEIDCWEDYKYSSNGKLAKMISHDASGKIPMYSDYYYANEIQQENFTPDKLTYSTTPEQYIEYLNKNNISYKIDRNGEEDNNRSIVIGVFDENNKKVNSTWWYYGENKFNQNHRMLSHSMYNDDEAEIKRFEFKKDRTEVTTYLEKRGKDRSYLRTDVPQENFTKEHITAETTPDEYIQYLKENNKKFKVKEKENWISITEFDENGKEIQYTGFEKYKWKFSPDYSVIMREVHLPNGNRKRISFSKTDTCVENFSYD